MIYVERIYGIGHGYSRAFLSLFYSRSAFGVTIAGEFSNGYNDCGLFVNGVANGPSSAADCDLFSDASKWDQATKEGVKNFALASMDALGDWFFWTWKVCYATSSYVSHEG